jgi:hypothetical protein
MIIGGDWRRTRRCGYLKMADLGDVWCWWSSRLAGWCDSPSRTSGGAILYGGVSTASGRMRSAWALNRGSDRHHRSVFWASAFGRFCS